MKRIEGRVAVVTGAATFEDHTLGDLQWIVGIEAYVSEWLKRLMPVGTHELLAGQMKKFMASGANGA